MISQASTWHSKSVIVPQYKVLRNPLIVPTLQNIAESIGFLATKFIDSRSFEECENELLYCLDLFRNIRNKNHTDRELLLFHDKIAIIAMPETCYRIDRVEPLCLRRFL